MRTPLLSASIAAAIAISPLASAQNAFTVAGGATPALAGWCGPGMQGGTGDFNADGAQDLFCRDGAGSVWIALESGTPGPLVNPTTFTNKNVWLANFCPATTSEVGVADFNGDGLDDVFCYQLAAPHAIRIAINSGSSTFTDQGSFLSNWCATMPTRAKLNADSWDDLLCFDQRNGGTVTTAITGFRVRGGIHLPRGYYFSTAWPALTNFCGGNGIFGTADLSNRHQTDVWCHFPDTGQTVVAAAPPASGNGFAAPASWGTGFCQSMNGTWPSFGFGDVDGDRRPDAWCWDAAKTVSIARNSGAGLGAAEVWKRNWCSDQSFAGIVAGNTDLNGDGLFDLVCRGDSGTMHAALAATTRNQFLDSNDAWSAGFCTGSGDSLFTGHFDVNGSGTDLLCWHSANATWQVAQSTATGLRWQGGAVLTGTVPVYFEIAGNISLSTATLLGDFVESVGGTAYGDILRAYSGSNGTPTGSFHLAGVSYDTPTTNVGATQAAEATFVANLIGNGALPDDPSGIYVMLAGSNVTTSDASNNRCGHHSFIVRNGKSYAYAVISAGQFFPNSNLCGFFRSATVTTPNNDLVGDNMASNFAHELFETVSNPFGGGWRATAVETNPSSYVEDGDLCNFLLGTSLQTSGGVAFNLTTSKRRYLVQEMWVPTNEVLGVCAMSP